MKKWLKRGLLAAVVLLVAMQLVPYGRAHDNPPVGVEPAWPSARVKELARRACFDCHSHETAWPWHSSVAPLSWLVQHDVDDGRKHLNFSAWDRSREDGEEAAEELLEGAMPPAVYLPAHPQARLTEAEKAELAAGLRALPRHGGGREGEHEGEREGEHEGERGGERR